MDCSTLGVGLYSRGGYNSKEVQVGTSFTLRKVYFVLASRLATWDALKKRHRLKLATRTTVKNICMLTEAGK